MGARLPLKVVLVVLAVAVVPVGLAVRTTTEPDEKFSE